MKSLLLVIAFVGCSASDSDFPILVQGGDHSAGASRISGSVCVLTDFQVLSSCATTGLGGLTVTLGGTSTITAENGTFVLNNPTITPSSMITVTGSQVVPSQELFTTTSVVPVVSSSLFGQVLSTNNIAIPTTMGSIIASVVDANGEPLSGIFASSTPLPVIGPFFDSTVGTLSTTSTGLQGIAFFPGLVSPGPVTLTFNPSNPTDQSTISDVRILEGGVSFVNAELRQ